MCKKRKGNKTSKITDKNILLLNEIMLSMFLTFELICYFHNKTNNNSEVEKYVHLLKTLKMTNLHYFFTNLYIS